MEDKFSKLPDYMSVKEVEACFNEFIEIYKGKGEIISSLEALNELAERQWNTYEFLSDTIKVQVEEYLKDIIEYENYEVMDWILVIVPKLGLTNVYNLILKEYNNIGSKDVKNIIDEAKLEYGEDILNPYNSLR